MHHATARSSKKPACNIIPHIVIIAAVLSIFFSCTKNDSHSAFAAQSTEKYSERTNQAQLHIVASIFPCYDLARAVAGTDSAAAVKLLVKPGTEIHSFDPSPADILAMHKCDIFLCIGGESEKWADKILDSFAPEQRAAKKIVKLIDFADTAEFDETHTHEEPLHRHNIHEADEHIWTSPLNAVKMLDAISNIMQTAVREKTSDSEQIAAVFAENTEAYRNKILAIDNELHEIVRSAKHDTIVMGDRFPLRYFAEELQLRYESAFSGCSTAVEASPSAIARLIDIVKKQNLPAVFSIEMSSRKIANAIAEAAGVPVLELHSCHNVSRTDFENGETYISLMRRNADALKKGLNQ
ncbi:MAG: metal ABC transporter substrate-binding protein [Bacteroides sp.]|nr:metal ABC transporter substrate-binding protein [Prevotella sp.]MCM1407981.1 metal ABC transporter substrate-binding protein [Treponema brennaborense]MCM1468957.1 metal ABC transporter substrate-binding protein [Bacteroides sp.]